MNKFTDQHGHTICDGAEIYFNGRFPDEVPTTKRIRNGMAIIDGDKLVFAVNINNQLQGIGLYWELDGEPCYDLEAIDIDDEDEEDWSATEKAILALDEKYPKAIAIFGEARLVQNIEDIIRMLPSVIHSAKFFGWHDTLAGACRTFCSLCFVDPALVECYIGMKFETLTEEN